MGECIFCKIVSKEVSSKIVKENEEFIAFEDINPQAPVHILVVPKKHIPSLAHITPEEVPLLGRLLDFLREIAKEKGLQEKGYRVVNNIGRYGGQSVYHLHFHLLGGRPMGWPPG